MEKVNKSGVDLSVHNGNIDFEKLSKNVDFVMLRGGYSKTVDKNFIHNAKECEKYNLPYGVYWFSYAFNDAQGKGEANFLLETLKENELNPTIPIAFDYEYDSYEYAKKKGQDVSANNICKIAKGFLDTIIKSGHKVMLYTNLDYYTRIFKSIVNNYPIWLAQWNADTPAKQCVMWQYSSTKKVSGVIGYVDSNIYYDNQNEIQDENKKKKIQDKFWDKYMSVAQRILQGEFGNGAERKARLKEQGLDSELAQDIVNYLVYG